jgi:penicillin-binding protein 2
MFMNQLSDHDFSVFQEKMYRFPGFYAQKRSIRQYEHPYAAHVLGDVAEVSPSDIEADEYYQPGDYIGKLGVERSYEKYLRGEKGVQILLRDAHGRIQGSYKNGELDSPPVPGKNLTLGLDLKLQALAEQLLEGKIGSVVAIEPTTGEVLCMASSPNYDPRMMVGRQRSKNHRMLSLDVWKPLLNRSIMGQYPPGSTFKTTQGLTFLTEGVITPTTQYPCYRGFVFKDPRIFYIKDKSIILIGQEHQKRVQIFYRTESRILILLIYGEVLIPIRILRILSVVRHVMFVCQKITKVIRYFQGTGNIHM